MQERNGQIMQGHKILKLIMQEAYKEKYNTVIIYQCCMQFYRVNHTGTILFKKT